MFRRSLVLFLVLAAVAGAGPAPWPERLPRLRLFDPLGAEFSDEQLKLQGTVVVVTAPTQSQADAQQGWHDALRLHAKDKKGPAVAMVEDLSQSWVRPLVLARMRELYRPGGIVLLLDESGATHKSFGVAQNATVAFAFSRSGKLTAVETAPASSERALKLIQAARQE